MTEESNSPWVDAKQWTDRWVEVRKLQGGGQGQGFQAERRYDSQSAFVKVIKSPKDEERRGRFFREASAYDSFRVDGIPRLIESNAHQYGGTEYGLYLATEFIDGPTLRGWRETQTGVNVETACIIVDRLLEIVAACHASHPPCVHRDIKPDNIILKNGTPADLWLLDFGLSYRDMTNDGLRTEQGQEIGNRFLRLPELSAGSEAKQDPRSDVSFVGGVMFYVLTGEAPNVLQDADGRMPHQRSSALAKLQAIAGPRFGRLAGIFDSCFAPRIHQRYSNADAMRADLNRMITPLDEPMSADENMARIEALLSTAVAQERSDAIGRLSAALSKLRGILDEISDALRPRLTVGQTGYSVEVIRAGITYFWKLQGAGDTLVSLAYDVVEAGDEIVFLVSGLIIYRTNLSMPEYGDSFADAVRTHATARIRSALEDPIGALPEADLFREVPPPTVLHDAVAEAQATGRHVLAFVFDPAMPKRGELSYVLKAFLRNRTTRDTMNASFVTALIPLSQLQNVTNVLEGKSMEHSRWVVFDTEMQPKEQDVIYANGGEAEKIIATLAAKYLRRRSTN